MDEYNLANVFLDHSEITIHNVDLDKFQKIPFTELASLGGMIAELVPYFRTTTSESVLHTDGLFQAINPKTHEIMPDLMYKSKQIADTFVGSLVQKNGKFDQAAFKKATNVTQTATTVAAINPGTLLIAAGIMAMSKKLTVIEDNQRRIMKFLEDDKESRLRGNLNFLFEVFNAYKFNWDNTMFRQTQHGKTQDIKQEAEGNIDFYRKAIGSDLLKRKLLVSRIEVKKNMKKLINDFANYRLSIYLYSFASFLEVILLENYKTDYLQELAQRIRDFSFSYAELYTSTFDSLKEGASKSLETGAMKGIASAAKGLGHVIEKIPIIERGQLDENLIAAGSKLTTYNDDSIDGLMQNFVSISNCLVLQFADLIEQLDTLHNSNPIILTDSEALYVQLST